MGAVGLLARREIRRRWRSTVALALLIGVVGAIVLAVSAGARRSDTALDRFNDYSRPADVEIYSGRPTTDQIREFRRTPGITALARVRGYALGREYPAIGAPVDDALDHTIDRSILVAGRYPDPSSATEATIAESVADNLHLQPGSSYTTTAYTQEQIDRAFSGEETGDPPPAGPRISIDIVGIVRRPLDLGAAGESDGLMVLTPEFVKEWDGRVGVFTDVLRVRTERRPGDLKRVVEAAERIFGDEQTFGTQGLATENQGARNAIDVIALALWIAAAVTALAGLVTIGIVLAREISGSDLDQGTLRGMGLTRRQRIAVHLPRAIVITAGGLLIAGAGAVALSPLFPFGIARRAEPHPGVHADWTVLVLGLLVLAVLVMALCGVAAWRASRPGAESAVSESRRTSAAASRVAAAGGAPSFVNGLRLAFQRGRGEAALPVRSALAGAVFGATGVAAALVFAASLAHLVDTPRLFGWTWDLSAEVPSRSPCVDADPHGLQRARGVEAVGVACTTFNDIAIDGRPVSVMGFRSLRGTVDPAIVEGRAPRGPDEIALGKVTLDAIGKDIGDTVQAKGPDHSRQYTVVGRVVLPSVGEPQALADGAAVTEAGFEFLYEPGANETHYLLVPVTDPSDRAAVARLLRAIPRARNVGGPIVPAEVERLDQIDAVPLALAALMALLGLVAVTHAVVSTVRRRRDELAVLKVLGFTRVQVRATVAWQASTLAAVGLVIGMPLGVVTGRTVWRLVANGLGIDTGAPEPVWWLCAIAVAALVVVNVAAAWPARAAARARPAVVLREG
jgi:ABC-type lipoprotein release transport system permease subunit